jgi:hypothetical protein
MRASITDSSPLPPISPATRPLESRTEAALCYLIFKPPTCNPLPPLPPKPHTLPNILIGVLNQMSPPPFPYYSTLQSTDSRNKTPTIQPTSFGTHCLDISLRTVFHNPQPSPTTSNRPKNRPAAVITGIGRFRDEDGCDEGTTPAVSHRKAAELRRGKRPADVGLGPGNPLFIMSSVYNPLSLSPLLMWMCACDLCHLCPLLLHVPVFPHPPSTTGTTKETTFESSTLRYLNHPPHPLQTPISSCGCTPILKIIRPAAT